MSNIEPIKEFLKRRLRDAGAARFEAIAESAGVTPSFIRKFVYGGRENPRIDTIQPLLDYFSDVDRGERQLPDLPRVRVSGSERREESPLTAAH